MSCLAIIGKPNCGKSLLFNSLTGLNQKVTNFPGVTVNLKKGQFQGVELIDFPGMYSFSSTNKDESIAVSKFSNFLSEKKLSLVICVLDATNLQASLTIGLDIQKKSNSLGVATVFVLNMMDEIEKNNLSIDIEGISKKLNTKIFPVSAKTGFGLSDLRKFISSQNYLFSIPQNNFSESSYQLSKNISDNFGIQSDVLFLRQNKLDQFFLSPVLGFVSFFAIMLLLFQSIFSWSVPFMDLIESLIGQASSGVQGYLSEGIFRDFVGEALFGGVGSFLVFVPQIFFLTLIVSFLEDSGYLARAAMICHRPLKFFGLSGKSFIPFLTGHACAIPAIFAARTIASPRRRFLTILTVPLMSCSARLPVYALLISAVIPAKTYLWGMVGLQGLSFFMLYALGVTVALVVSFIFSKSKMTKKITDSPFIIELPAYRLPNLKSLLMKSGQATSSFVIKAGGIIFTVTIMVWLLGYFPEGPGQLSQSYLAYLGRFIEPFMEPLGLDWKYGVAILTSFLAREVFVGTLGTMFGIEGADENVASLVEHIQASGLTFASGFALLVFYAIALQCASTLAVMKKELGSYKIPTLIFIGYSVLAYVLAVVLYQIFI